MPARTLDLRRVRLLALVVMSVYQDLSLPRVVCLILYRISSEVEEVRKNNHNRMVRLDMMMVNKHSKNII